MHIQAKDKNEVVNMIAIQTNKYVYRLYGSFEVTNENKDEYMRIMSTFACKFNVEDVYDLSNVKDGFRRYENEKMKISFDVPENYFMSSSEDIENLFEFVSLDKDDYISEIHLTIYSKDGDNGAEFMANKDYLHNKTVINEKIATYSEGVVSREYDGFTAYEYNWIFKYEEKGEEYGRDVFFEVGDYVYNISVSLKLPVENYEEYVTRIINSIKADKLDSSEIGILIRDDNEATGKVKSKVGGMTVEIPNNYLEGGDGSQKTYVADYGIIVAQELNSPDNFSALRTEMKNSEKEMEKVDNVTIIVHTAEKKAGDLSYMTFTAREVDENGEISYTQMFATVKNKHTYLFVVGYGELGYSENNRQEVLSILATLGTK